MQDSPGHTAFAIRLLQVITLGCLAGLAAGIALRFALRLGSAPRVPVTIEQPCPIQPPNANPGRQKSPTTPIRINGNRGSSDIFNLRSEFHKIYFGNYHAKLQDNRPQQLLDPSSVMALHYYFPCH